MSTRALLESTRSSTMVHRAKPGQTAAEGAATVAVAGLASNAVTTQDWSTPQLGDVDATACLHEVIAVAGRVTRGDLSGLEALLTAQAVALNALFTDLARRARTSTTLDPFERYLRLALKAQSMCRATVETVATIKNPPIVFARQANVAHGPQQVNNLPASPEEVLALARVGSVETRPNELLEAHGERLDLGEAGTASAGNSTLATVGTVDRPADGRGKGAIGQERGPRRRVATRPRADRPGKSVAPRRS